MINQLLTPDVLRYGPTLISLAALGLVAYIGYLFVTYRKDNGIIKEQLTLLEENHIHELKDILVKIDSRTEDMNNCLAKISERLDILIKKRG